MPSTLVVNETFYSIQGEGTRTGQPCVFVRLTGCHLRCRYCDTEYAFHEGVRRTVDNIIDQVDRYRCDLVEITGGEPLLQPGVHELMSRLSDAAKTVLLETSGACDVSACDPRVIRIVDFKTPDSGEADRNQWSILDHLNNRDEVKFVLCSRGDYKWARHIVYAQRLHERVAAVLFSAVHEVPPGKKLPGTKGLRLRDLTEWILNDRLPVRIQVQLHKVIWHPMTRGV